MNTYTYGDCRADLLDEHLTRACEEAGEEVSWNIVSWFGEDHDVPDGWCFHHIFVVDVGMNSPRHKALILRKEVSAHLTNQPQQNQQISNLTEKQYRALTRESRDRINLHTDYLTLWRSVGIVAPFFMIQDMDRPREAVRPVIEHVAFTEQAALVGLNWRFFIEEGSDREFAQRLNELEPKLLEWCWSWVKIATMHRWL